MLSRSGWRSSRYRVGDNRITHVASAVRSHRYDGDRQPTRPARGLPWDRAVVCVKCAELMGRGNGRRPAVSPGKEGVDSCARLAGGPRRRLDAALEG